MEQTISAKAQRMLGSGSNNTREDWGILRIGTMGIILLPSWTFLWLAEEASCVGFRAQNDKRLPVQLRRLNPENNHVWSCSQTYFTLSPQGAAWP